MRYKNISQRARRYARSKNPRANITPLPLHVDTVRAQSFADGYRFAVKEMRQLLDDSPGGLYEALGGVTDRMERFVNDTERLK